MVLPRHGHVPDRRKLALPRWTRDRVQRVAAHARVELNRVAGAAERYAPERASFVVEHLKRPPPRPPARRKHRQHYSERDG